MKLVADYHTHTAYSHGKGSIEENALAAIARGLSCVAITDHGPGHKFYGVHSVKLEKMRREVDALNKKYAGKIKILLGIELNLLSLEGDTDCPDGANELCDLLLMGYHRGVWPKSGLLSFTFKKRAPQAIARNTRAMCLALTRYPIKIVSHPGEYIPLDITMLAKTAAKTGAALEINASHPAITPEQIRLAKAEGARFALSSDAHTPERVGDFGAALRLAAEAGLIEEDIINASSSTPLSVPSAP